jgi:hypothetical protein
MARTPEDLTQELLVLREENQKWWAESDKQKAEIKSLRTELDWWRKTFGPSEFAK